MPTLRISTLIVASLFLYNATDAHADAPPANADGSAAAPAADNAGRPPLGVAIGLGVGGLVLVGAGIGIGAVTKTRGDEQSGNVNNPPLYTKHLQSQAASAEHLSYAAYALMGVGGAALVADLVVWIEYLRKSKHGETAPTTSLGRVTPTPAGLQVSF